MDEENQEIPVFLANLHNRLLNTMRDENIKQYQIKWDAKGNCIIAPLFLWIICLYQFACFYQTRLSNGPSHCLIHKSNAFDWLKFNAV